MLFYIIPFAVILGILMGFNQHYTLSGALNNNFRPTTQIIVLILFAIFAIVTYSLITAFIIEVFKEYHEKGPDNLKLESIWEKTKETLGTVIATSLGLMGMFIGLVFIMVLVTMVTPWFIAVFIIPLFYVMVVVYFVFPIRVYENAGMGEALSRSFYLINGNWWWTFLIYLVVSMAVGLIGSIFIMPQYAYIFFITFTQARGSAHEVSLTIMILTSVLTFVGQMLINSIPLIALNFQYFNLLEKKDKPGLQMRIDEILPNPAEQVE